MLFHLVHPVVFYLTGTQPAPARLAALDAQGLEAIDPELRDPLLEEVVVAQAEGFGMPVFCNGIQGMNFEALIALFERPDGRALAFIHAARSAGHPTAVSMNVSTRFEDGRLLITSNFGGTLRTPPRPHVDGIAIPTHFGAAPLWAVHRHRVEAREIVSPAEPMTRGSDPVGHEFDELCGLYEYWVQRGYYRRLPDGGLRSTVRGAALAAWRGLWPWKQWTDRRNERHTADAVRDMPLLQQ